MEITEIRSPMMSSTLWAIASEVFRTITIQLFANVSMSSRSDASVSCASVSESTSVEAGEEKPANSVGTCHRPSGGDP